MARRRHPLFTPLDLYNCYPGAYDLALDSPCPLTSWDDVQRDVAAGDNFGDTLFLFLVRELGELDMGLQDQIARLYMASHDIMAVQLCAESMSEGGF